jgi:hypothetical protein
MNTLKKNTASPALIEMDVQKKHLAFSVIFMGFFFVFVWLAVFNVAIMTGDDVVHFTASLHSALLPQLHHSWTPNRVIDIYGRSIFSAVFSFLFFSMNGIVKVSFFTFYKIFSTSLFAIFTTCSLAYFLRKISINPNNKIFKIIFFLMIAVFIFQIFYWRNQVHFICYQLPALLTFVLLKTTFDSKDKRREKPELTGFVFLSYLCAFSLESYTLTILMFSILLLAFEIQSNAGWSLGKILVYVKEESCPKLLLINLLFSTSALAVMVFFSERSQGVVQVSYMNGIQFLSASKMLWPAVILLLSCVWVYRQKSSRKIIEDADFFEKLSFSLYLGLLTLVVAFLISMKSNTNYFSMTEYPWGDLMLIGKIAMLYLFGLVIAKLASKKVNLQALLSLLLVFSFSKLLHFSLERIENGSMLSMQVEKVYKMIAMDNLDIVDTGLNLDSIPMQIRPFPSATSPKWFIDSYRVTFHKFSGIETLPTFK